MTLILCDGCGQPASSEHTARRLQRLEWATRYRPIHLHTLLLGAISPVNDADYLYSPGEVQGGEAASIFAASGLQTAGKTADMLHAEFHRRGLFLTHVLECSFEVGSVGGPGNLGDRNPLTELLSSRLPTLFTRIRRSLKPKRIALISESLDPLVRNFLDTPLGGELLLDDGHPFLLNSADAARSNRSLNKLQQLLSVPSAR